MVVLRDWQPLAGGIYLEVQDYRNPDVLTMFINHAPSGGRTLYGSGVRPPEEEREAWTFDLDAIKKEQTRATSAFPPWASGTIRVAPTAEGRMWRFDITPDMLG
jgi:hypothetical protein